MACILNKKLKGRHFLLMLLAVAMVVAWNLLGDTIRETRDRHLVQGFKYDPEKEFEVMLPMPGSSFIRFPHGQCVKVGEDVICYARSLGHHTAFGFRRGYSYVNVNGKTYWKPSGPCGTLLLLSLGENAGDGQLITEDLLVKVLRENGFGELK